MNPPAPWDPATAVVAVLYQAIPPPVIDGIRKPMKPGGYADSGADIAYVLRGQGVKVVTPRPAPRAEHQLDWVFPDDRAGLAAARGLGANVLWANTILFHGHPLEAVTGDVRRVGQPPALVEKFDDKWTTNSLLRQLGWPVAASVLVSAAGGPDSLGLSGLDEGRLQAHGLKFPLVIKPVRGRGSQGVVKVDDLPALVRAGAELLATMTVSEGLTTPTYGTKLILEEFLAGEEITITVMPPGTYAWAGGEKRRGDYWTLPAVVRFNHQEGIAPYAGVVSVVENSRVVVPEDELAPEYAAIHQACITAAGAVSPLAPIRVDCRRAVNGPFLMFDLNMKPNMTGAGRPGREKEDSLTCLAARAAGWSYGELLKNMLRQAWRVG